MKKFFFAVTLCAALAQAQNRPPANADPYANNAAAGTADAATTPSTNAAVRALTSFTWRPSVP